MEKFVRHKMASWVSEVNNFSVIAAFTHGQSSKWNFLMRTISDFVAEFQPLEDATRHHFLPAIAGRQVLKLSDYIIDILRFHWPMGGVEYTHSARPYFFCPCTR